ncbi:MAG: hypothetical protein CMA91_02410 [Euryarchaeota archaeon]|jgi:hypothetical protein|nr:hypothetical protein [Euryarchaeota archaeon]|tara:strand:- start:897 stop:1406 length:510 start_codon:yes stop_codon:yes gene_type:complete
MISSSTFHVITTELTVGMFALSGVAFLLCLIRKGPISRESVAHWALLGGLIATPFAIISGINSTPSEGITDPLLANKVLLSMTSTGIAIGVLMNRKLGADVDLKHSSLGLLSVGLMLATAGIGGEYSRGETLLFLVPKETVFLFPLWASIMIAVLGIIMISKSAIQHRI